MLWYSEAEHSTRSSHSRSDVSVSRVEMYSDEVEHVEAGTHTRSVVLVGCAVRYWSAVQVLMDAQIRSEVGVVVVSSY